ncbi:hypothetical protein GGQ11_002918 [Salinibacter ruber]|nr:hypothetical protein [Salinibacter ruber]
MLDLAGLLKEVSQRKISKRKISKRKISKRKTSQQKTAGVPRAHRRYRAECLQNLFGEVR